MTYTELLAALAMLLPAAVAFDVACAVVVLAVTSRKYGLRRWWDRGDTE